MSLMFAINALDAEDFSLRSIWNRTGTAAARVSVIMTCIVFRMGFDCRCISGWLQAIVQRGCWYKLHGLIQRALNWLIATGVVRLFRYISRFYRILYKLHEPRHVLWERIIDDIHLQHVSRGTFTILHKLIFSSTRRVFAYWNLIYLSWRTHFSYLRFSQIVKSCST